MRFLPIVGDDAGTPATGLANSPTEDAYAFESLSATVPLEFNQNELVVHCEVIDQSGLRVAAHDFKSGGMKCFPHGGRLVNSGKCVPASR
jgi:hypothetical protein